MSQSAISTGLAWLAQHVNPDGGWGDTDLSLSNLSTTTLGWAAFGVVPGANEQYREIVRGAERWLSQHAGGVQPELLAPAIIKRYGRDRTFSVPILTMCALAGRLGPAREAWKWVLPLPFELAACPHSWFAALRLPVVSYALPALIALGHARHHHRPTRNPVTRTLRNLTRRRTLQVLSNIQPASGGFLEATPLTSFVTMSLAASDQASHPVTHKCVEFLLASVRPDGSWPIDTNLATWVTTLAVNALAQGPDKSLSSTESVVIRNWLLGQQFQTEHPYTHAAPGGWAWTPLPGGVPDADDTAGALLALRKLSAGDAKVQAAASAGVTWLLNLQNRDGGIPTFCRGWTNLPFDRSSPDLTAHALRAWNAWAGELPPDLERPVRRGIERALRYLANSQRKDGSWVPLWFGNQHAVGEENPIYGTSKVLLALQEMNLQPGSAIDSTQLRGIGFLAGIQRKDGSWGGSSSGPASVEETALALEALVGLLAKPNAETRLCGVEKAVLRGAVWLIDQVENGAWKQPSPIGFYFARLWYYERLYPQIFSAGVLSRMFRLVSNLNA